MRVKAVSSLSGGVFLLAAIALAAPETAPKPVATPPAPLAHGPIATYDAACARCHGPNGSFYGPTLGKSKTDAQLRQVIKEMAEGPSQLPPLPPIELDAQTAYHRALIKAEPFLAVTTRTKTTIEGEVTSGATVTLTADGKPQTAKMEGSHWSASLSAKNPTPVITARIGKTTTILDSARAAFSHTAPLADPSPTTTTGQPQK
jgi:hypothetical protein